MAKLKVVFHVEDEDKNVVVEKSQLLLEIGGDPHCSLTAAELARDHIDERVTALAKRGSQITPEELETLKETKLRQNVVEEFMTAAGDIVQRFIRLKLRDWARGQLEKV